MHEQRFASAHLFGAVCPTRGTGAALVLPEANTTMMNLMLAGLAWAMPDGTHAVLVLDRSGWHIAHAVQVPADLTLVLLPSHAPELNPIENVRQYMRERWLSHRVLSDDAAILDAACDVWNRLVAELDRLASLTRFPRLLPSIITS